MKYVAGMTAALSMALLLSVPMGCRQDGSLRVLYGNFLHYRGDFTRATIAYLDALEHGTQDVWIHYNLANVYMAFGEIDVALAELVKAERGDDSRLRFRASFNQGNLMFQKGEFEDAAFYFVEALQYDPGDRDAKYNLELALKQLRSSAGTAPAANPTTGGPDVDVRDQASRLLDYIYTTEKVLWSQQGVEQEFQSSRDW